MTDPALCKRLAEFMGVKNEYPWHPDTDIAQAMMVAERIGGLRLSQSDEHWYAGFHERPLWQADAATTAISLAADAWLRQGGGR